VIESLLKEYYGLTNLPLPPLAGGNINQVFRAGDRYVLKRYNPALISRERVVLTTDGQEYLKAKGHPVPGIIRNRAGLPITEVDGVCYVLSERIPGRHRQRGELSRGEAYNLGRTLGRIVLDLVHYRPEERGCDPRAADGYDFYHPNQTLGRIERALALAQRGSDPVDLVSVQALTHRRDALQRMAHWYPRLATFRRQWIHGDFHEMNTLFADDGALTGVIDWDNLRWGTRAFEFMRGLAHCFPPGAPERDDYFRGYAEVVHPTDGELELYAPLWTFVALSDTWPVTHRYLSPETYNPSWDGDIAPPSDWWERHMDEVTAWLLALNRR
jgi:Ser/Thr protein kinase RdoA (MazF antagonist)